MPETVMGLTGAFGSGCTTAAKHLRDSRAFHLIKLSEFIRQEWREEGTPTRADLQRLGDDLRRRKGPGILADLAIGQIEKLDTKSYVVIDGIRNTSEVARLRDRFGYAFTLIGILSDNNARWGRISTAYTDQGLNQRHFLEDDDRDKDEEVEWGQQVELCMDSADVLIDNSSEVLLPKFQEKVLQYTDLVSGKNPRPATPGEILMNMAYSSSHSSKCLKRHVGAVLVDAGRAVVGVGYNENPLGTNPCVEEPQYNFGCYRDIVRNNHFTLLSQRGARCPVCGEGFGGVKGPPWRCSACQKKGKKTNLETFFFPDRAMNWCTAVHAEVWALLSAGDRARGGTLYCTTFPCFQCAEKLIQSRIKEVWYTEAYPDAAGQERFRLARVKIQQFEGVRSSSFDRIFSRLRPR